MCRQFRGVCGDINNPKYDRFVKLIKVWGEELVALRLSQDEEVRAGALEMARKDVK